MLGVNMRTSYRTSYLINRGQGMDFIQGQLVVIQILKQSIFKKKCRVNLEIQGQPGLTRLPQFLGHCLLRSQGPRVLEIISMFFNRFGVCCLFITSTSGATVSQNCSYIQNPNFPSAYGSETAISFTVSKCATGITYVIPTLEYVLQRLYLHPYSHMIFEVFCLL